MLYYLAQSGFIDLSSLAGLATQWKLTLVATLLFIIGTCIQALRLKILIKARAMLLSSMAAIRLTFIGLFFSTYLPGATGGDLIKIYYASKGNPGRRTEVITILLLDRFIGLFSLISLPVLLAPFYFELISMYAPLQWLLGATTAISFCIIIATVIGIKIEIEQSALFRWIGSLGSIGKLITKVLLTVHAYRHHLPAIFTALLMSYLLQLMMVGIALIMAYAMIPSGAVKEMLLLIPMAYPANMIPITPGGLGVGEAAMETLFNLCQLDGGSEISLGWRLTMILSGLLGLLFFLKGGKQFIYTDNDAAEK